MHHNRMIVEWGHMSCTGIWILSMINNILVHKNWENSHIFTFCELPENFKPPLLLHESRYKLKHFKWQIMIVILESGRQLDLIKGRYVKYYCSSLFPVPHPIVVVVHWQTSATVASRFTVWSIWIVGSHWSMIAPHNHHITMVTAFCSTTNLQ